MHSGIAAGAGLYLVGSAIVALAVAQESRTCNIPFREKGAQCDAHGGVGEIKNASVCPLGNFMVGFRGRAGLWIDQIRIRCAPLLDGGGVGNSTAMAGAGGPGGSEQAVKCNEGHIIYQINSFTTNNNRQVEYITFHCMKPANRSVEGGGGYHGFGNPSGVRFRHYDQVCPEGEAAVGLAHRWGEHVNAVGLICDVLRRP